MVEEAFHILRRLLDWFAAGFGISNMAYMKTIWAFVEGWFISSVFIILFSEMSLVVLVLRDSNSLLVISIVVVGRSLEGARFDRNSPWAVAQNLSSLRNFKALVNGDVITLALHKEVIWIITGLYHLVSPSLFIIHIIMLDCVRGLQSRWSGHPATWRDLLRRRCILRFGPLLGLNGALKQGRVRQNVNSNFVVPNCSSPRSQRLPIVNYLHHFPIIAFFQTRAFYSSGEVLWHNLRLNRSFPWRCRLLESGCYGRPGHGHVLRSSD